MPFAAAHSCALALGFSVPDAPPTGAEASLWALTDVMWLPHRMARTHTPRTLT
jgi:hypothetical protein